jgi:diadenosine tetraphosphate (Ap4A) HIT family hydrolase
VVALPEEQPHTDGHTVVIPRRHVPRVSGLTEGEHAALWSLARRVADDLEVEHSPDVFTLGMNDGPAAGQSTPHVHLHVVPRRHGDHPDPRGGIRRALPDRPTGQTR